MSEDLSIGTRQRYFRFRVGQVVALTEMALKRGLQGRARSRFGRVVAVPSRLGVVVRRDGMKSNDSYWAGFWRPVAFGGSRRRGIYGAAHYPGKDAQEKIQAAINAAMKQRPTVWLPKSSYARTRKAK